MRKRKMNLGEAIIFLIILIAGVLCREYDLITTGQLTLFLIAFIVVLEVLYP